MSFNGKPNRSLEVLEMINNFYTKNGYFPLPSDMLPKLKFSKVMYYEYLDQLELKKLIKRNSKSRLVATDKYPPKEKT